MSERRVGGPRGFESQRIFDAPRERVWREWTTPEAFADWFGGADAEVPIKSVEMDVRVGGEWRATMFAGGREMHWRGTFEEIDEPERLVLTITDEPDREEFELCIVVLRELGDGRTEMTFSQQGEMTDAEYERAGSGWGVFFDRMAERVASG